MINFDDVIARIKESMNYSANLQVAELFGLSAADFSKRKKTGTILPIVVEWAINKKVNIDWLLTGKGTPYIKEETATPTETKPTTPESNNVVELQHIELVRRFTDKPRAKGADMDLLEIEKLDRETFIEVVGFIKGVANNLKMASEKQAYASPDLQEEDSDQSDNQQFALQGRNRRSGLDRRKTVGGGR